jgi:4-amino-4-deoxy-L-arabinose transferase-like glycosyltransferase
VNGLRAPVKVRLVSLLAAGLGAFSFALAFHVLNGHVRDLLGIDYELSLVLARHPPIAAAALGATGVFLLLLAVGLASGWPWTRWGTAAAFAVAALLLMQWAVSTNRFPAFAAGLFLLVALAYLAFSKRARRWFDGRAFASSRLGSLWSRTLAAADRGGRRIPLTALAATLVAAGVAARIATVWGMQFWQDGNTYAAMGHAWMQRHELVMPWGDIGTIGNATAVYSHHFPPVYPVYLGMVYSVAGYGVWQTKMAALAVSLASLAVAYACGRDLYGRDKALLATGLLALDPHLVWATGTGFTENMVLLFFVVTLWGILKSLEWPPAILVAGIAAGLAYLTRSSVGSFFVIAGVGGLLWRFWFLRWRLFANLWYVGAIAVFLAMFTAWAARNVALFGGWPPWDAPWSGQAGPAAVVAYLVSSPSSLAGPAALVALLGGLFYIGRPRSVPAGPAGRAGRLPSAYAAGGVLACVLAVLAWGWVARNGSVHGMPKWETSSLVTLMTQNAFQKWDRLAYALLYKAPFFLLFFLGYGLFLLPELRASVRRIRDEHESALWLAIVLMFMIGWLMSSIFWVAENSPLFWLDNRRYIVIAFVPLLWMALRFQDISNPRLKLRVAALALSLAALTLLSFLSPVQFAINDAVQTLDGRISGGDTVGFAGVEHQYAAYSYLPRTDIQVVRYDSQHSPCNEPEPPRYLVESGYDLRYACYVKVATFTQPHTLDPGWPAAVFQLKGSSP